MPSSKSKYANNPINLKKRYLSKPFNSSGGYNISFSKEYKKNYYLQEYLQGETYSISFFNHKEKFNYSILFKYYLEGKRKFSEL